VLVGTAAVCALILAFDRGAAVLGPLTAAISLGWLAWDNVTTKKLRDRLVLCGATATLVALLIDAALLDEPQLLARALGGGLAMYLLLTGVVLIWPYSIGYGTAKASVMLGLAAGAWGLSSWVTAMAVLGATFLLLAIAPKIRRPLNSIDIGLGIVLVLALGGASLARPLAT
jgi:hypothetical protein